MNNEEIKYQIKRLREQGWTLEKIANEVGMTKNRCAYICKKNNIPTPIKYVRKSFSKDERKLVYKMVSANASIDEIVERTGRTYHSIAHLLFRERQKGAILSPRDKRIKVKEKRHGMS